MASKSQNKGEGYLRTERVLWIRGSSKLVRLWEVDHYRGVMFGSGGEFFYAVVIREIPTKEWTAEERAAYAEGERVDTAIRESLAKA